MNHPRTSSWAGCQVPNPYQCDEENMLKEIKKQALMAAAIAALGLTASASYAQAVKDVVVDGKGEIPYLIDGRNVVARSGYGLCWRTGYWSPAAAGSAMAGQFPVGCDCDPDVVPKEKCTPPAPPAPPVAGPKPAAEKIKLAADTLFDFDKATLRPEGKAKLDDLVAKSKQLNLEVILAVGHTDRIGSDSYNQKQSVTGTTCNKMGPENGKNAKLVACLQPDRRVEIELIGTK